VSAEPQAPAARGVSAVVATYNRRGPLRRAIDSALSQTDPLYELIVIDDGSSDGTWQELEALAGRAGAPRVIIRRQENAGPSAARNAGARLATGEFLAFLDSDDQWQAEKNSRQLAVFDALPAAALVGCVDGAMPAVFRGAREVAISERRLLARNYFVTPGVMVRRVAFAEAGGFAEDLRYCEDYDLWLRLAARYPCVLLNEPLVVCSGGTAPFLAGGLSARLWPMQAGELEVFRRWRKRGGGAPTYAGALAVCWLRFARRLALRAMRGV
jgi:glycosyltransferase involved in cell wall biosynthesis